MVSKLIDGTFPDYQDFVPKDNNYKLTINYKLRAGVVYLIYIIPMDKFQAIKLFLTKNLVEVYASGEARGVGKETTLLYSRGESMYFLIMIIVFQ